MQKNLQRQAKEAGFVAVARRLRPAALACGKHAKKRESGGSRFLFALLCGLQLLPPLGFICGGRLGQQQKSGSLAAPVCDRAGEKQKSGRCLSSAFFLLLGWGFFCGGEEQGGAGLLGCARLGLLLGRGTGKRFCLASAFLICFFVLR